jgi:hypothetical protein
MVTHMRYTLLMLAALLGVNTPPSRPPGHQPAQHEPPAATVPATGPCPYPDCQGRGSWRKKFVYRCNTCDRPFYYCTDCKSFYQRGKEGAHKHEPPAA